MKPSGTDEQIAAAFRRLQVATQVRTAGSPIRDLIAPGDEKAAYAVQRLLTDARVKNGARVVGRKIGLTSPALLAKLGLDHPDYGMLFDDMACPPDEPIDFGRLLQPKVEPEVAFVLADDLTDPAPTAASVRGHIAYMVAAIEIVDSRIAGWDLSLADTIADNGSAALFVLGSKRVDLTDVEPATVRMSMTLNGAPVATGTGQSVYGDPLKALAWLAATAVADGNPLRAGQVVLTGSLGPQIPVGPRARVHVEITGLGTVGAAFSS